MGAITKSSSFYSFGGGSSTTEYEKVQIYKEDNAAGSCCQWLTGSVDTNLFEHPPEAVLRIVLWKEK